MLTITLFTQPKPCSQKFIWRFLFLLLLSLLIWQISLVEAWAASPGVLPQMESAPLESVTPSVLLTNTQTILPDPAVCPTTEATSFDYYQNLVVSNFFKATVGLAETIPSDPTLQKRVNILLLGSDSRPGEKFGRTDTMIVVTIDPAAKTAGLLSIPRDLWVSIPGYAEGRINQAHRIGGVENYPGGGPALAVKTVEANLGMPIDFYVLVDFEGFKQVIDTLDGLDLCVPETIDAATYYGYVPEYVNEAENYSFVPAAQVETAEVISATATPQPAEEATDQAKGYEFLYIEAGWHTLDGATALTYARSRASVTADFARVQRQQAVLLAIKNKALQMDVVFRLPELWQTMCQTVQTNLTLAQALQLAQLAYQIDAAHIQTAAISHDQTMSYRTASGASVLLPKRAELKLLVENMVGPVNPTAPPTQAEIEAGLAQPNAIAQTQPVN